MRIYTIFYIVFMISTQPSLCFIICFREFLYIILYYFYPYKTYHVFFYSMLDNFQNIRNILKYIFWVIERKCYRLVINMARGSRKIR